MMRRKHKDKASNAIQPREPLLSPEEKEEFRKYVYPFENLAFEGGGSKGIAYVGAIRTLEEIGVWRTMKRFSGTSAGSIGAMLSALGYDSYEIEELMSINLAKMYFDAALGKAGLPMLKVRYGLHPGRKFLKWLGDIVATKLGNPDATFADLYNQTGRELCVVAVNVNQLGCEYCHVKTTPDMPIRIAVRMSSAIPGVVAPVKYKLHGVEQLFCDGGLVINYPIHVFDGWFLSMAGESTFLNRIPDLRNVAEAWDTSFRFGTESNKATIGILLYSEAEQEMFKVQLNERIEKYISKPASIPDTKFARSRQKAVEKKESVADEHDKLFDALSKFINLLKDSDADCNGTISRDELKSALDKAGPEFGKAEQDLLFGENISPDELFDSLDANKDGEITLGELVSFAEQRGIQLRKAFRGFESRTIHSVTGYFDAIVETLLLNMKKIFMRGSDLHRTIGINTMYLDTLDFDMEPGDKAFLLQQGKDACMAFLRYHIDIQELTKHNEYDDAGDYSEDDHKYIPKKFFSLKRKSKKSTFFSSFRGSLFSGSFRRNEGNDSKDRKNASAMKETVTVVESTVSKESETK